MALPPNHKTDQPDTNLHKLYSKDYNRRPYTRRTNFRCMATFILMESAHLLDSITSFTSITMVWGQ
jgi:hypothetical protein